MSIVSTAKYASLGKEVINRRFPYGYLVTTSPVMNHKVVSALPKVKLPTSFCSLPWCDGRCVQGRERIHRSILIHDY